MSNRRRGYFHAYMKRSQQRGELVVQPRMGFSDLRKMRRGLQAVRDCAAPTIGTITVDSFTRTGELASLERSLQTGSELNGYPLVTRGAEKNRELLEGLFSPDFPVQVRHGTPRPQAIFQALLDAGLDATEGGPVSYCLPYSRLPLTDSLAAWKEGCRILVDAREQGIEPHLESFGGCMMGQLCPPSLLLALDLLEGLFFRQNGLTSLSLSYAQGSNEAQDVGAIRALHHLAAELLPDVSRHVVVYTFMGFFPQTADGARRIIESSARLAVRAGAARLITKTIAEAHRIPTIEENVSALLWADAAARRELARPTTDPAFEQQAEAHREVIESEARSLVEAVLNLSPDLTEAIAIAFRKGYLDVPFCLHPDNRNRSRAWLDDEGIIRWSELGRLPFPPHLRAVSSRRPSHEVDSRELLEILAFNQQKFDRTDFDRTDFDRTDKDAA